MFFTKRAKAEGLKMSPIQDEHGQLDRAGAAIDPADMRFTFESLHQVEDIKSRMSEALRRLSLERTMRDGRTRVNCEDIRACLADAIAEVTRDVASSAPVE